MKPDASIPCGCIAVCLVLGTAAGTDACSAGSAGGPPGHLPVDAGASGSSSSGGASVSGSSGGVPLDGGFSGSAGEGAAGSSSGPPDGGVGSPSVDAGGELNDGSATCSSPSPPSAKDSVVLDMAVAQGAPTYRASGFISGVAQDGSQPPDSLLSEIKVQGLRTGGAHVGCPNGGFVNGQYAARWNVVKAYYTKAKAIGARMLVDLGPLWGVDSTCPVPHYPGDSGDWTQYTAFVSQVISDMQANGMTGSDVRWEMWNEPDLTIYWKPTQAQWLEMWRRGYQQIRAALPGALFEGPSVAGGPGGAWASAFLDYIKANSVVPDYISWHLERGGDDPVSDANTMNAALSSRGIMVRGYDGNEYGTSAEQNPGHSAWYLARFERAAMEGLRGNWAGGLAVYQNMGDLVAGGWQPNSQFWIYRRYADQTGLRTSVTAGSQVDAVAYQDVATTTSIIVVGNKGGITGPVNIVIKNIPSWLQSGGSSKVVVETMPAGTGALSAPAVVSSSPAPVICNAMTVTINWTTATDGYVVTLTPS